MPWMGFCTFGWLKPNHRDSSQGSRTSSQVLKGTTVRSMPRVDVRRIVGIGSSPKSWDTKMEMKHGWGNNQEVNRLHNSSNFWIFHCQVSQV